MDDAPYIAEVIKGLLEETPYISLGSESDPSKALERVKNLSPDVVIVDLVMPHPGGLELAKSILFEVPAVEIIACSSLKNEFVREKILEVGIKCFLEKPFGSKELKEALRQVAPIFEESMRDQ